MAECDKCYDQECAQDYGSKNDGMHGEFRKASQWRLIFGLGVKGKIGICFIDKGKVALWRERGPLCKNKGKEGGWLGQSQV